MRNFSSPFIADLPFPSVDLKIARARMHAESLNTSLQEWQQRSPLRIRAEISEDRLKYKLSLDEFSVPPPVELWGMMIGDCVHNLRSALDNLCYRAARLKQDPPADPGVLHFPIFTEKNKYSVDNRVKRTLCQLPTEAVNLLEHFQPFSHPDPGAIRTHALLTLHHLSNHDKHRIPQIAFLNVGQHDHVQKLQFESERDARAWVQADPKVHIHIGPIWSGSVLMSVTCARPAGQIEGKLRLEPKLAIDTPEGVQDALSVLETLGTQATTILLAFKATFPHARD